MHTYTHTHTHTDTQTHPQTHTQTHTQTTFTQQNKHTHVSHCPLYTTDAADETDSGDLGRRRRRKKKEYE